MSWSVDAACDVDRRDRVAVRPADELLRRRRHRHDRDVVEVAVADGALRGQHADDLQSGSPSRVTVCPTDPRGAEQLLGGLRAEHDDVRAVGSSSAVKNAPGGERAAADVEPVGAWCP